MHRKASYILAVCLACVEIAEAALAVQGSGRAAGAGAFTPQGPQPRICAGVRSSGDANIQMAGLGAAPLSAAGCCRTPGAHVPCQTFQNSTCRPSGIMVLPLQLDCAEIQLKATVNMGHGAGRSVEFLWRNPSDRPQMDSQGFHSGLFQTTLALVAGHL